MALGHAAWAKLTLIYKGLIVSAHGHSIGSLAQAAIHTAQTVGVTAALQAIAQMLIIIGSVSAGSLAAETAWDALRAMAEGDQKKALKKALKALRAAGPVLKFWTPSPSGW